MSEQDRPPWLICDEPVGANRCRLPPHPFGKHDVAPDYLLERYRVPGPLTVGNVLEMSATEREQMAATLHACPATRRPCSCRPGERCNPAVYPARGPG